MNPASHPDTPQLYRAAAHYARAIEIPIQVQSFRCDRHLVSAFTHGRVPEVHLTSDLGAVKNDNPADLTAVKAEDPVDPHPGAVESRQTAIDNAHRPRNGLYEPGYVIEMALLKDQAAAKRCAHQIQPTAYPRSPHTHRRQVPRLYLSRAKKQGSDDLSAKYPVFRPALNLPKIVFPLISAPEIHPRALGKRNPQGSFGLIQIRRQHDVNRGPISCGLLPQVRTPWRTAHLFPHEGCVAVVTRSKTAEWP